MNATEVELMVRDVILQRGLPFAILSVNGSPAGWNVVVRAGTGGIVRFMLPGGGRLVMRNTIQEKLKADG